MRNFKEKSEETGLYTTLSDAEIAANEGKTYQDATALRDPLMGLGFGEENPVPFKGAAQDAVVMDYNPYRDPETGRYTNGPGKISTASGKRDTLNMSKTERRRVSSGILTDYPNLKQGDKADYFFGNYYYRFTVKGPGDYNFTERIRIIGNESYIDKVRWRGKS